MGILAGCRTEIEKNLGDVRVGQGLPQEALLSKLKEQSAFLWARTERGCLLVATQLHCCWWGNPVLLS